MFACRCSTGSSSWRTSRPSRWCAKIRTARNFCLRPWSITCCRNSEALSCLSALWSEDPKAWRRTCSRWAAVVSSPFTTSARFSARRPTVGQPSLRWFRDALVLALRAWEKCFGSSVAMTVRTIWLQRSATTRWPTSGGKSRRWERSEAGELSWAKLFLPPQRFNHLGNFQPRNVRIWWIALRLRWLRWRELPVIGRALRSTDRRLVELSRDEHSPAILPSCGARKLHLRPRRLWFEQLPVIGGAIRSTDRVLGGDASHDVEEKQLWSCRLGLSLLHRRKRWHDVYELRWALQLANELMVSTSARLFKVWFSSLIPSGSPSTRWTHVDQRTKSSKLAAFCTLSAAMTARAPWIRSNGTSHCWTNGQSWRACSLVGHRWALLSWNASTSSVACAFRRPSDQCSPRPSQWRRTKSPQLTAHENYSTAGLSVKEGKTIFCREKQAKLPLTANEEVNLTLPSPIKQDNKITARTF